MSTNPFDDENGRFIVLVNSEEQYSLWPVFRPVPEGWEVSFGDAEEGSPRADCMEYIERTWTDMRPASIR